MHQIGKYRPEYRANRRTVIGSGLGLAGGAGWAAVAGPGTSSVTSSVEVVFELGA